MMWPWHRRIGLAGGWVLASVVAACAPPPVPELETSRPAVETFGTLEDGSVVDLYTLTNANGMQVRVTSYGATVVSIRTPDREGRMGDVVLGFDTLDDYRSQNIAYLGVVAGRYANRIGNGRLVIDGQAYALPINNAPNHLHGGPRGFDKVLWSGKAIDSAEGPAVQLEYLSPDGDQGYPGNLRATVTYTLTQRDELRIAYAATTDRPTVVNLTNHSYFNLSGRGDILDHELLIAADRFTPVNDALIPTGALQPVENTPFDFREMTPIGARIDASDSQLAYAGGYDHNWVINREDAGLALAARLFDPASGRVLEVRTTEPGLQFYAGNFLDGTMTGKGGTVYERRSGLCLETQHFPDSPNQATFPSTRLDAGERYETMTVFAFSAR